MLKKARLLVWAIRLLAIVAQPRPLIEINLMPATATSAARIAANQRNALLSTGPKTVEGKARSRTNAVKHGLTGAGIALPTEDAAAIEARFLQMQEDLAPTTLEGSLLVHLAATMSIQIERAGKREAAVLAMVGRHAGDDFELARLAEIDRLFDTIETNPRDHHRRLQTSIEGVDLLLAALQGVRDQVESGYFKRWTATDRTKIDAFLGGSVARFPVSRADALLLALQDNLIHIPLREQDRMPAGDAREPYFRDELILLVDVERARLDKVRAGLNPAIVVLDRSEAIHRASIPLSPETILVKKYQAAAISTFLRALRDFHKLDKAEAAAATAEAQPTPTTEVAASAPVLANAVAPVAPELKSTFQNEPNAQPAVSDPHRSPGETTQRKEERSNGWNTDGRGETEGLILRGPDSTCLSEGF